MRNNYFNTFFTLFLCVFLSSMAMGQVYVKHDAGGSNDGSSWSNAYTDLQSALDANNSEIWIAAGTYVPGGNTPDTSSTFSINSATAVYGGFAGTETMLAERDVEANLTILSGDLNNDDIPDDYENNRLDNANHVVYVDSLISSLVQINGLTIYGGNTSVYTDLPEHVHRGGGIYALSPVAIAYCHFEGNFGVTAAAVYLNGGAGMVNGSTITHSSFTKNFATERACVYMRNAVDILVEDCEFKENTGYIRGVFYPSFCDNVRVNRCLFDGNVNPTGFGGAIWNWHSSNLSITNCDFKNNFASSAGVIYLDSRNRLGEDLNNVIDQCTFDNNSATNWGSAVYMWQIYGTQITNSTFKGNIQSNGGAVYFDGTYMPKYDVDALVVRDCNFENNQSNDFWSGGFHGYKGSATIDNCRFVGNVARGGAGLSFTGSEKSIKIQNCHFEKGEAQFGGAMNISRDSTTLEIANCTFFDNLARTDDVDGAGGAIYLENGVDVAIKDCHFIENKSDYGGAISGYHFATADPLNIDISKTIIEGSIANWQGGAINISGADLRISNVLAFNNFALGRGNGGAISANATDSSEVNMTILNSTIANNFGLLAAGISQWDTLTGQCKLTLQNTILHNPDGKDYLAEGGSPILASKGGNLSSDISLVDLLIHTKDQVGVDPLFVDADAGNFYLRLGSPAIDAGVEDGAPIFDMGGNPRIGEVDAGSYEFDLSTEVVNIIDNSALSIAPNPVQQNTNINIDNDWQGSLFVELTNTLGQVVKSGFLDKHQTDFTFELDLTGLESGIYQLRVAQGKEVMVKSLIKL